MKTIRYWFWRLIGNRRRAGGIRGAQTRKFNAAAKEQRTVNESEHNATS